MKYKKGEITTKQLVTLIILILSFVVILFLLFRLDLGETSNKQICHNSVVLKSQSELTAGNLDCRTSYVCISGGEDCKSLTPTSTIEVDPGDKDGIMKAIADEMADCWWMFGEDDEVRYTGGRTSTGVHCAICSIIEIGEDLDEIFYSEFHNYLESTSKDESQTYLEYLYGINDYSSFSVQSLINLDIGEETLSPGERHSVITGIDNNLIDVLDDDEWLKVYLIPTEKTSETDCGLFITKA
jgi:hypothetical protein